MESQDTDTSEDSDIQHWILLRLNWKVRQKE